MFKQNLAQWAVVAVMLIGSIFAGFHNLEGARADINRNAEVIADLKAQVRLHDEQLDDNAVLLQEIRTDVKHILDRLERN